MIDAHNHLNDAKLHPHIDALLSHMTQEGVTGALVVGFDLPSSQLAVQLARMHPCLRVAIGVHPHESTSLDDARLDALRGLATQPEVVAIGEIGLDYHYDLSPRDVQRDAFRRQLALAKELDLPIVIHEREAAEDLVAILDAEAGWACGGTWHCCSVSPDLAMTISERLYVGIAGWVTFKNGENIREIARQVPLDRLLVETDAPYLTPVPHRGKLNEPSYVRITAQAVAQLKGISVDDVEKQTVANTFRAFPRWKPGPEMEDC